MTRHLLILGLLLWVNKGHSQTIKIEKIPRQPFLKHSIFRGTDSSVFYLSESASPGPLPLIVYIQGSGNSSLFARAGDRIVPRSGHMTFFDQSKGRYRVLILEKPGVNYLQDDPENPRFDAAFSLESWSDLLVNTINLVLERENIDRKKIMLAGHSEGGLVAAAVASKLKDGISHVSIMAGEGPSQLYSLFRLAEQGVFFGNGSGAKEQRLDSLEKTWNKILADPYATGKKFWGFTYLRWSSFLTTSVQEQLAGFRGNILIIQGTHDTHVFPESAKVLYASLLSKGRKVRLKMIEGADHSFHIKDGNDQDGWHDAVRNSVDWFLE